MSATVTTLAWNEEVEQTADVFETSSVVYDTGFPGSKTQLCHERNGSIGAVAQRRAIEFAGVAFEVCFEIWSTLLRAPSPRVKERDYTTVTWSRAPFPGGQQLHGQDTQGQGAESLGHIPVIKLTRMMDVINALVPYTMHCGVFPSLLSDFSSLVAMFSDPPNPVQYFRQTSYITVARFCTSSYAENRHPRSARFAETVFETEIAKHTREGKPNAQLKDDLKILDQWIIDKKSIIIQHWWYSLFSLGACALLEAGGVALIAVEDKAKGVDPSNLTALAWAAAGFIMIYFRSKRVQDWPWRDFLRGRIVCRSISEVQSVTKQDPQMIMSILLRQSTRSLLHTHGPYNTLFSRKADDGFSIDVPLENSTVVNGGYIFVRVDSISGPALVALSALSWERYNSVSPTDRSKDGECFICRDLHDATRHPLEGRNKDGEDSLPLYTICTNDLHWFSARGVFSKDALFD